MQGSSDSNAEFLDAASLCRHLVPAGSVHAFLADHRQRLFPDVFFEDLFVSRRGRPSVPADVVATVLVLQALEGLSDREAGEALRRDIAWKAAAGLSVTDEGFHPTVLTYWRARLRASDRPERVFDAVRDVITETGVLAGKSRRALDSTVLDDAVATQDTVTQLVGAIRRVRRVVPGAGGVELGAHDYEQPGKPECAWDDSEAKDALVTGLVNDARALLNAVDPATCNAEQADALGLLALVAGQDVEPGDEEGRWRIARGTAPDRVISVVDPESRHVHKSVRSYRDGYKAHIAVEPETGLVTATVLTAGNAPDGPTGVELLAGEEPGLEVLADSAYGSGETRAALRAAHYHQTIKPIPRRNTRLPGAFTKNDFIIDLEERVVTCPAGHTKTVDRGGDAKFGARCRACPLRSRCTTSRHGRTITLHPHEDELLAAHAYARDPEFIASYRRWRPMVERSIAWLVADGNRRVRYRGIERNQHGLSLRVAAINLRRLVNLGLHHEQRWRLST
jgi:IS5 family transposase